MWQSCDSSEYCSKASEYLYKEKWGAGPETKEEDIPQAQPRRSDGWLIPGYKRYIYKIRKSARKMSAPKK